MTMCETVASPTDAVDERTLLDEFAVVDRVRIRLVEKLDQLLDTDEIAANVANVLVQPFRQPYKSGKCVA
jgi:hypothetical protein